MADIIRPVLPTKLTLEQVKQALKLTSDNISRLNERLRGWDYTLQHGTELLVESPVPYQVTKAYAVRAVDPSTNLDVELPLTTKVRQVSPGVLGITVQYAPPLGRVSLSRATNQAINTGTITGIQWTGRVVADQGALSCNIAGTPPANDSVICSVAGEVEISGALLLDTFAGNNRLVFVNKNASTQRYGENFLGPAAFTAYYGANSKALFSVAAGDILRLNVYYDGFAGPVNVIGGGIDGPLLQARYVAPDPNLTARVTICLQD